MCVSEREDGPFCKECHQYIHPASDFSKGPYHNECLMICAGASIFHDTCTHDTTHSLNNLCDACNKRWDEFVTHCAKQALQNYKKYGHEWRYMQGPYEQCDQCNATVPSCLVKNGRCVHAIQSLVQQPCNSK